MYIFAFNIFVAWKVAPEHSSTSLNPPVRALPTGQHSWHRHMVLSSALCTDQHSCARHPCSFGSGETELDQGPVMTMLKARKTSTKVSRHYLSSLLTIIRMLATISSMSKLLKTTTHSRALNVCVIHTCMMHYAHCTMNYTPCACHAPCAIHHASSSFTQRLKHTTIVFVTVSVTSPSASSLLFKSP